MRTDRHAGPSKRDSTAPQGPGAVSPKLVDLTGRERHLRAAMQAMAQVAERFCRAARRTLPFMVRQKAHLVAQPVSILSPTEQHEEGPCFDVFLEAEEMPAWGMMTLNAPALRLVLEGSLGAQAASGADVGSDLTLAQRALIARVARDIAQRFAEVVRDEVGLTLGVVSAQARGSGEPCDRATPDGLRVDCMFESIAPDASISIIIGAEALELAARDNEEDTEHASDPRMAEALREVPVEVVAELGSIKLSLRNVLGLKVGQVVRLSTAVDDPIVVKVARIPKFAGKPVVSRGQVSVEIRGRLGE
jgi:flagellar motor switch protein FliM